MRKNKRPRSKTLAKRNALKVAKTSLHAAKYAAPLVPVGIEVGINWDEWFNNSNGFFVGSGFIMLMLSTFLTYLAVGKKKKLFEKFSAFWNVAIILFCWGTSFMLLSSILHQIGFIFVFLGFSIVASAIADETETHLVDGSLAYYQELVDTNGLDMRAERRKAKREAKRKLAEEEAKAYRERVDLL